jgi:hypothetical protein
MTASCNVPGYAGQRSRYQVGGTFIQKAIIRPLAADRLGAALLTAKQVLFSTGSV